MRTYCRTVTLPTSSWWKPPRGDSLIASTAKLLEWNGKRFFNCVPINSTDRTN